MTIRRRLATVAVVYAVHLGLALSVGIVAASLASELVSGFDAGDRVFFEPGALYASEALRLWREPLTAVARAGSALTLVVAYLGLVPLGALLAALGSQALTLAGAVRKGTKSLGPLSLLLGATLATQALAATFFGLVGIGVRSAMESHGNDRRADLCVAAVWLAGAAVVGAIGIIQDLARARIVCDGQAIAPAVLDAARSFSNAPIAITVAWGKRAFAALPLVLVSAWTVGMLGTATTGRVIAVLLIHQTVALGLIALRVSWLRAAVKRASREMQVGLS